MVHPRRSHRLHRAPGASAKAVRRPPLAQPPPPSEQVSKGPTLVRFPCPVRRSFRSRHLDWIKAQRRVPQMVVEASGRLAQRALGQPLVEVFSVVLRLNNPGGKLYGTISVDDGARCQYIYNRKRDEGDSSSAALLNGPAGGICALDSFVIDVDLMDDIKGQISWNVYDVTNVYYRLLQENVNGKTGFAIVNYAVFRDAVEAIVEVILFNGDGNDPAYVYGQITARNTNFTNESTLFQKTWTRTEE